MLLLVSNSQLAIFFFRGFFAIPNPREGRVVLAKPIDYEQPDEREFNFQVQAKDPSPGKASEFVKITLPNFNCGI